MHNRQVGGGELKGSSSPSYLSTACFWVMYLWWTMNWTNSIIWRIECGECFPTAACGLSWSVLTYIITQLKLWNSDDWWFCVNSSRPSSAETHSRLGPQHYTCSTDFPCLQGASQHSKMDPFSVTFSICEYSALSLRGLHCQPKSALN